MRSEYHKIPTILKRDQKTNFRTLIEGEYATPELKLLADIQWDATEKVDGTNIRVIWDGENVTFGGRTEKAQIPAELVNHLNNTFTPEVCKKHLTGPITLYGEGYGNKIQKIGKYYRADQSFVLFDAKAGDTWLNRETLLTLADDMEVLAVAEMGIMTLQSAVDWARDGGQRSLLALADLNGWEMLKMEGLILRPREELKDRLGNRIIAKIKVKDFKND